MALQWTRANQYIHIHNKTEIVPSTCCKLPGKYPDFGEPINEDCTIAPDTTNSYYDRVNTSVYCCAFFSQLNPNTLEIKLTSNVLYTIFVKFKRWLIHLSTPNDAQFKIAIYLYDSEYVTTTTTNIALKHCVKDNFPTFVKRTSIQRITRRRFYVELLNC